MDESDNLEDTQKVDVESDEGKVIAIEGDVVDDDNSESLKETTRDDNGDDEPKEEDKVALDSTEPVVESVLSQECSTQVPTEDVVESESKEIEVNEAASAVVSNGIVAPILMDVVVSNGIEASLDESETNGVSSDIVKNLAPEGVESSTEATSVVTDLVSKEGFEETKLPDLAVEPSVAVEVSPNENAAANILQPADEVPGAHADNGCENGNASDVQSTIKQRYISVIPSPVQRTSWRGCCGLFEVLKRSDH